uniref:Uncharacterized protein n=1 Tax=Rhizophagus irregularis (strain DAOM 181602 / DAOM 197198 / MUCL 43194) TaxID=747089 RepID=U9UKR0_RHIID
MTFYTMNSMNKPTYVHLTLLLLQCQTILGLSCKLCLLNSMTNVLKISQYKAGNRYQSCRRSKSHLDFVFSYCHLIF